MTIILQKGIRLIYGIKRCICVVQENTAQLDIGEKNTSIEDLQNQQCWTLLVAVESKNLHEQL